MSWIKEEVKGKDIIPFIAICLLLCFLCSNLAVVILFWLNMYTPPPKIGIATLTWYIPIFLLSFAFIEEIIFRLPLAIFIQLEWPINEIVFMAIFYSAIFGFYHGGITNIFIQGVGGFILCIIFLKCGGYQKKYLKAIIISTLAHFFYNAILVLWAILDGRVAI